MFNETVPPIERSFEENVRYLLDKLALEVSLERTLEKLAELAGVHPTTLSHWRTGGDVPAFQAKRLENRFGRELAPSDKLSKEIALKALHSNK